jgi:hypothetical protein
MLSRLLAAEYGRDRGRVQRGGIDRLIGLGVDYSVDLRDAQCCDRAIARTLLAAMRWAMIGSSSMGTAERLQRFGAERLGRFYLLPPVTSAEPVQHS